MKLTNRLNLPEVIVAAVSNDPYDKEGADFSVTELLKPPRAREIARVHDDEITEDVADVIYRLMGKVAHQIIQNAKAAGVDVVEKRYFWKFTVNGKEYTLSGQADLFRMVKDMARELWDWKVTSMFQFKDGVKHEFIAQLNMLRYLIFKETGEDIQKLVSAPIYRDWSAAKASYMRDYPRTQIEVFPVSDVWSFEKTEEFIKERIALHLDAQKELPECTAAERWATPDMFKVMKIGGSRAITGGVHTNQGDADAMSARTPGTEVVTVRGTSKRCPLYCSAFPFCDFAKSLGITAATPEE